MKTQFNQSQGSTSRETNKEAIARIFGLKKSDVGYLSTTTPIDSYVILFDKETQTCWYRGDATGTPISWAVSERILSLTTSTGTYQLGLANAATKSTNLYFSDNETAEQKYKKQEIGTDSLYDSQTAGKLDKLYVNTVVGAGQDLRKRKFVVPNGSYSAARTYRTRGLPSADPNSTKFELLGQGSTTTILNQEVTGVGDFIYADYLNNVKMGGFTLDNTPIGAGSGSSSKNGQMWIRHSRDTHFDDILFRGGDALSYCLDHCVNILSTNLKVDFQYRYPVGDGKSPLIVGDYSEQCMFIGGYIKSVSEDGTVLYSGDLADNDQANDTKWAFINVYGLKFSEKTNSNACMWQEGQGDVSNAHFIGMNYIGNGVGHGVSEKAMGTCIGSTFRQAQVRAVWNRARFISIGGHFLNNIAEYPAGTGGNSAAAGGIHCDNPTFMSSVGDYFDGNIRDLQDYTGATTPNPANSIHLTGNRHSASLGLSASGLTQHIGIVNSQLSSGSTLTGGGNGRLHGSIVGSHIVDSLGSFGHGQSITNLDIVASTFSCSGSTDPLVTQSGVGVISFSKCVINDYTSIVSGTSVGNVSFESCTFNRVTFTAGDLSARYINCRFNNCVNAPNVVGLNFAADSILRPSTARCEFTATAGGSYTFPSWVLESRGVYGIKIGGRGANLPCSEFRIAKTQAVNTGTITPLMESSAGNITVTWLPDSQPVITFTTAGTYTIKIG
ncbi:putative tail fiber protein [Klebsiella virus vB_KpnM-20]|nr:putative tail fiber protein [Klebsiella virus vB_KpnM-20]